MPALVGEWSKAMSWNKAADYAKKTKAPGRYLRIEDGDQITVVPLGEPVVQYQVWSGGTSESVEPGHPGAQARFSAEVYSMDTGEVHVLGMAPGLFQTVAGKIKGDHDKIIISRDGAGLKTKYSVVRVGACSKAEVADIQAAQHRQDWDLLGACQGAMTIREAQVIVDRAKESRPRVAVDDDEPAPAETEPLAPDEDIPF